MLLLDITWTDGQTVGLIDAIQIPSDFSSVIIQFSSIEMPLFLHIRLE
jgi:hypothetical protein